MSSTFQRLIVLVCLGSSMMVGVAAGQGNRDAELQKLRKQNSRLSQDLVAANKRASESEAHLKDIKLRLEALGSGVLGQGDERLVSAVSDIQILTSRLQALENSSLTLANVTREYLATAIVADPERRVEIETQLRELETLLGLREKPQRDRRLGNLQSAEIISVDSESGVVLANVGQRESATIGMTFEIFRRDQRVADALVAQTRDDVSALVVLNLHNNENPVRSGDRITLKRN